MTMRSTLPASLLTLCMLLTLGCPRGEDIRGRYEAEAGADSPAVILELKEEGKGGWVVEGVTAPFSWELRGQEVVLYTKSGGILAGTLEHTDSGERRITLDLPGVGRLVFHPAAD
jgi:hypothetical protein